MPRDIMRPAGGYALRARLRDLALSRRESDCGVRAVSLYPAIEVSRTPGGRAARFVGILRCGHIWTCAVCSIVLRAKRAAKISHAVHGAGGRWQLLTATLRHRDGMALYRLMNGLAAAWRRTRQGGRIQRIWSERVTASVRATEVTHGEHGWHPHIHVLLRTSEWSPEDRAALSARWARAVREVLGDACEPSDEHGLVWSESFNAGDAGARERSRYLSKLGLEVSGFGKRATVAERAAARDPEGMRLWREFQVAARGRRMIEMDDRAAAFARQHAEEQIDYGRPQPPMTAPPLVIELWPEMVAALRQGERHRPAWIGEMLVAVAAAPDPAAETERWLSAAVERRLEGTINVQARASPSYGSRDLRVGPGPLEAGLGAGSAGWAG